MAPLENAESISVCLRSNSLPEGPNGAGRLGYILE